MKLHPQKLITEAQSRTGLEAFGAAPLTDGLAQFTQSLNNEAHLHESGVAQAENQILNILEQRLKVENWCSRYPEIEAQAVSDPIMVFGLPRSGTTALSQFLAQDPALRSIRRWEAAQLTPPPDAATQATDPRIAQTREAFEARNKAIPGFMSMLPVTAEDPSEHGELLGFTFRSLTLASLCPVPSYTEWALSCDMEPAYAYFKKILQLLQWRCPPQLWNLKFPLDLFFLDDVLKVFPDAKLVWCHRDPAKSIPSVSNLLYTFRSRVSDAVDKAALGHEEFDLMREGIRRGIDFLDRRGEEAVVHVQNADLATDPAAAIGQLYEGIGRPFSREFEAALQARTRDRPRGTFGAHRYSAAEFGLGEDVIRAAFANYRERFDIKAEM